MYRIVYHPDVVSRDIPRLDTVYKQMIQLAIERKLISQPEVFGVPLRRDLHGYFKLRIGDYRVIFRIEVKEQAVKIFLIEHRSVAYEVATRRKGA